MEEQIGFYVKRISEAVDKTVNAELRRFGLTVTQGRVLGYLHKRQGETVTQKDVEEFMGASHATISGVIQRLRKNGFITVEPDDRDRRAKRLAVTEKELRVYRNSQSTRKTLEGRMTQGMSDGERRALLNALKRVYGNLNGRRDRSKL